MPALKHKLLCKARMRPVVAAEVTIGDVADVPAISTPPRRPQASLPHLTSPFRTAFLYR